MGSVNITSELVGKNNNINYVWVHGSIGYSKMKDVEQRLAFVVNNNIWNSVVPVGSNLDINVKGESQ